MISIQFLLTTTLPDQRYTSWEWTKWSPKMKCLDIWTNSLKQCHTKCMKNGDDNGPSRVNTPSRCLIQVKTQSAKAMPASMGYCEPFLIMKYSPQNLHLGWWQDTILRHDDPEKRNIILYTVEPVLSGYPLEMAYSLLNTGLTNVRVIQEISIPRQIVLHLLLPLLGQKEEKLKNTWRHTQCDLLH